MAQGRAGDFGTMLGVDVHVLCAYMLAALEKFRQDPGMGQNQNMFENAVWRMLDCEQSYTHTDVALHLHHMYGCRVSHARRMFNCE